MPRSHCTTKHDKMHMDNREIVCQLHDGCVMVGTRIFLGNPYMYVYTKPMTEGCYDRQFMSWRWNPVSPHIDAALIASVTYLDTSNCLWWSKMDRSLCTISRHKLTMCGILDCHLLFVFPSIFLRASSSLDRSFWLHQHWFCLCVHKRLWRHCQWLQQHKYQFPIWQCAVKAGSSGCLLISANK